MRRKTSHIKRRKINRKLNKKSKKNRRKSILQHGANQLVAVDKGGKGCTPHTLCNKGEGDCDVDEDCAGNLVCYQREGENIPGLTIPPGVPAAHDFCWTAPPKKDIVAVDKGGNGCTPNSLCNKGEGDCDVDEDCAGNLVCYQREGENIPGLTIPPGIPAAHDFCWTAPKKAPSNQLVAIDKGVKGCAPGSLCNKGEGDCDVDEDCAGNLVCYQREGENIPGLTIPPGIPAAHDFCWTAPTKIMPVPTHYLHSSSVKDKINVSIIHRTNESTYYLAPDKQYVKVVRQNNNNNELSSFYYEGSINDVLNNKQHFSLELYKKLTIHGRDVDNGYLLGAYPQKLVEILQLNHHLHQTLIKYMKNL